MRIILAFGQFCQVLPIFFKFTPSCFKILLLKSYACYERTVKGYQYQLLNQVEVCAFFFQVFQLFLNYKNQALPNFFKFVPIFFKFEVVPNVFKFMRMIKLVSLKYQCN